MVYWLVILADDWSSWLTNSRPGKGSAKEEPQEHEWGLVLHGLAVQDTHSRCRRYTVQWVARANSRDRARPTAPLGEADPLLHATVPHGMH